MSSQNACVAVRDINLCTKECLCLSVCPTGATAAAAAAGTSIDPDKCIGCALCADICPSGAISMVMVGSPARQPKAPEPAFEPAEKKIAAKIAIEAAPIGAGEAPGELASAMGRSAQLVEDGLRSEGGFARASGDRARGLLDMVSEAVLCESPTGPIDECGVVPIAAAVADEAAS